MNDLWQQLDAAHAAGRPVALCRLVETRGSTPQKAGANMLVFPDGSQAGTLGGGCVEAEVKRRALAVLQQGQAEIATFQLDNDYGWDDGLICGGRMQVLIDPIVASAPRDYYRALADLRQRGAGYLEAIVFDGEKSSLPAAACFCWDVDDALVASTITLAPGDHPALVDRPSLVDRPRASAAGGVAFLPTLPRCRLVIVGGGHVGQAVGALAADLDFDVCVVDDRPEFASAERFPRAVERHVGEVGPTLQALAIDGSTYCIIVTRGHHHDEEALYHVVQRGARYVGMIGSRRKIKLIFDDLLNEGVPAEALEQVFAPLGIDIGSQTVAEIAVSIAAELVAHRNRQGIVPGRPEGVSVLERD